MSRFRKGFWGLRAVSNQPKGIWEYIEIRDNGEVRCLLAETGAFTLSRNDARLLARRIDQALAASAGSAPSGASAVGENAMERPMVTIPMPVVAPLGSLLDKPEYVQEVWDAFVKPEQDAMIPPSVEMRLLMAILRAVYVGLTPPSEAPSGGDQ